MPYSFNSLGETFPIQPKALTREARRDIFREAVFL
jgi:hypothetical protein